MRIFLDEDPHSSHIQVSELLGKDPEFGGILGAGMKKNREQTQTVSRATELKQK
jgi:hypothetical protein